MSRDRDEDRRIARRLTEEPRRRIKQRLRHCQQCGLQFPEDEMVQDRDEFGRPAGWFCFGCV